MTLANYTALVLLTISCLLLSANTQSATFVDLLVGDYNGDGLAGFVRRAKNNQHQTTIAEIYISANSKAEFDDDYLPSNFDLNVDLTNIFVGDFNGDGRDDILRQEKGAWDDDHVNTAYLLLSSGNGTFKKAVLDEGYYLQGDTTNLYVGDFDGDGLDDILRQEKAAFDDDNVNTAWLLLSNGDGTFRKILLDEKYLLKGDFTNLYINDFNGDGLADILRQEKGSWDDDNVNTANLLLSDGAGNFQNIVLSEGYNLKGDLTNLYVGDFNGDGLADLLRQEKGAWATDKALTAQVLFSTFVPGSFRVVTLSEDYYLNGDLTNIYVGDFDGDGKDDFLRQEKGAWDNDNYFTAHLFTSNGKDGFSVTNLPESWDIKGDLNNLYVGDFNGDGRDDFISQKTGSYRISEKNSARLFLSTSDKVPFRQSRSF